MADPLIPGAVLSIEMSPGRIERPMAIRIVDYIVKVRKPLLPSEFPEDVHIPIRKPIRCKNVMVRDDDNLLWIPDLGILAELSFENTYTARSANIVSQKNIRVCPNIISCINPASAARPG